MQQLYCKYSEHPICIVTAEYVSVQQFNLCNVPTKNRLLQYSTCSLSLIMHD